MTDDESSARRFMKRLTLVMRLYFSKVLGGKAHRPLFLVTRSVGVFLFLCPLASAPTFTRSYLVAWSCLLGSLTSKTGQTKRVFKPNNVCEVSLGCWFRQFFRVGTKSIFVHRNVFISRVGGWDKVLIAWGF